MAYKNSDGENTINKTFIFKTKCEKNDIISFWKPAAEEYCNYYNKLSEWIGKNLISMKIGDLAKYIDNPKSKYFLSVTDVNKKDLPLYKIFQKGFSSIDADNALYCAIDKLNPEGYDGNILGVGKSDYRRNGYVSSVISNFRTKMVSLKANVKWKKIDIDNVDEETLRRQTICDVGKYRIESVKDFKDLIDVLKTREESPQLKEKISRLECLYDYYSKNTKTIKSEMENMAISNLQKFGGCVRKSLNTITIHKQDSKIEKEGNTSFRLQMVFNKKPYTITLLGNRQVVKYIDGKRVDLIDIVGKHGDSLTFNIKNGELFVHLTKRVEFPKEQKEIRKSVGVDVNIKHAMLAASIVDTGQLKGYINLYRELVEDRDFVSTFGDSDSGKTELGMYQKMAETVFFGVLEVESLFERVVNQQSGWKLDNQLIRRERAMEKVFDRIVKTTSDKRIIDYVNYVKMLRAKYKAYFILDEKYHEKQREYDLSMGFTDESDERRELYPFINTETAKEILGKKRNVEQDLIGCRDNIVTYAFNVLRNNGYDTISVEYLDSSQFDKRRMPTPKSLLEYHKFKGKTKEEVERLMSEKKFAKTNYGIHYDGENKVDGIVYSKEGELRQKKLNFMNLVIKAIHFADIKDKFAQLCNNNDMNVIFGPSAFTSQMDSETHSLYYVEKETKGKNGKTGKKFVLADKKSVRRRQETHINGLNADFNAARNLEYIASNPELLERMTTRTKSGKDMYNTPSWNIRQEFKKNLSVKTINTFRELGNVKYGKINDDGLFVEDNV